MKRALADVEARQDVQQLVLPMVESMLAGEVRAAALRFLEKRG
jgi:hypothetical protein